MPPGIGNQKVGIVEISPCRAIVSLPVTVGAGGVRNGVSIAPAGIGGDTVTHNGKGLSCKGSTFLIRKGGLYGNERE